MLHINRDTALTDVTLTLIATNPHSGPAPPAGGHSGSGQRSVTLHTTQHHPFWDDTAKSWVDAADLVPGHLLLTEDGDTAVVAGVRNFTGSEEMRDLTVATIHTYYVIVGSTPVLVHNVNKPIGCGLNGAPIYDVPAGSSGGHGAGQRIPENILADYNIGVNADPALPTPLCSYCRERPATSVDHVEPRVNGGDLTDANTTPACTPCNSSKNKKSLPVWDGITLDDAGLKLNANGRLEDDWG